MGIYSRDYYRSDTRGWRNPSFASGCKWLVIANVVVFVLQLLVNRNAVVSVMGDEMIVRPVSVITELFELDPGKVIHGQVWRLVTYAFCHDSGNLLHILFNMLFLVWFGTTLERMYGSREFVGFYLGGALVSGIAFLALGLFLRDLTPAIGASGAVMAVVVLYAVHFPRDEIFLLGLIRVQIRFLVLFYIAYDLFPVLKTLGGESVGDGIAHSAHLGGAAFGYLYHHFGLRIDRLTSSFQGLQKRWPLRRRPPVRIYRPPVVETKESLDVKVDAILKKIQEHGEASLTDHEREVLRTASERYKGKAR
jgi:membrane associated rhomboid family serine protease